MRFGDFDARVLMHQTGDCTWETNCFIHGGTSKTFKGYMDLSSYPPKLEMHGTPVCTSSSQCTGLIFNEEISDCTGLNGIWWDVPAGSAGGSCIWQPTTGANYTYFRVYIDNS